MAKSNETGQAHKRLHIGKRGMVILLVIFIALVVAYVALSGSGATRIATSASAVLSSSPSYFAVGSDVYALSLASKSAGVAYVHVNKLPIFVNPILNVTLYTNNVTKVNTDSGFANLGLTLESVGSNNVTVKITALDSNLQLPPDSGRITVIGAVLLTMPEKVTVTSTTSTTTSLSTTTIDQAAVINTEIMTALHKNNLYGLILNYSVLYANTQNCTQVLYNQAYILHYGYAPSGPNTFVNVSVFVPYALTSSTTNLGNGNYRVAYSARTVDQTFDNQQVVTFGVNASTSHVVNTSIVGIFAGQSFITLQAGYAKAKLIGGACGIDVP